MSSLLRLEQQPKKFENSISIHIFLFLSYLFGTKTINKFIHSCSSFENHTRFQTKMGEVYTRIQTKTARKPYRLGQHIPYMAYIREFPLGGIPFPVLFCVSFAVCLFPPVPFNVVTL